MMTCDAKFYLSTIIHYNYGGSCVMLSILQMVSAVLQSSMQTAF